MADLGILDCLSGLADSDVFPLLYAHVTPHPLPLTFNPLFPLSFSGTERERDKKKQVVQVSKKTPNQLYLSSGHMVKSPSHTLPHKGQIRNLATTHKPISSWVRVQRVSPLSFSLERLGTCTTGTRENRDSAKPLLSFLAGTLMHEFVIVRQGVQGPLTYPPQSQKRKRN